MSDKALRYNNGKVKYSMIDLTCLEPCAKVLEFGAKKYARDNWKKGLPLSEVLDSLLRHVAALQRGEFIDPESGLSHIGHIQCNALFLGNPKATIDIESGNLVAEVSEELKDKTDDELGFTNGPVENDWSRDSKEWDADKWWERAAPVSMEAYDAFVYALERSNVANTTKYGVCGHDIKGDKDD